MPDTPTWFFCIGAQKAGTTWLYDYCAKHPEIHVPSVKEVHYFNVLHDPKQTGFAKNRRRSLDAAEARPLGALMANTFRTKQPGDDGSKKALRALVAMHEDTSQNHTAYQQLVTAGRKDEPVVADITPCYSVLKQAAFADMASLPGKPKFLFIMRDPIERTWSAIKMHRQFLKSQKQIERTELELVDLLVDGRQSHIMQRSMYQRTLHNLRSAVPDDQVLVLFYEDLFTDASMKRLCDFLGVSFVAGDYAARIRKGKAETIPTEAFDKLATLFRKVYEKVAENYRDRLPANWHTDLVLEQQSLRAVS